MMCPKCASPHAYTEKGLGELLVLRCRCGLWTQGSRDYMNTLTVPKPKALPKALPKAALKRPRKPQAAAKQLRAPTLRLVGLPCALDGCQGAARTRSKYCSRDCSNKNARARHQARRKAPIEVQSA